MNKEEIIELIKNLNIEEIKSLVIMYYREKNYGYDTRDIYTLEIKGE